MATGDQLGWADYLRHRSQYSNDVRQAIELSAERLNRIKEHSFTTRIRYPEHQAAFDYVDALYGSANVKQAIVYQTSKYLLQEVGYTGVGGFYDTNDRVVVITDQVHYQGDIDKLVVAKTTIDEILCHELIHYCANFKNQVSSRGLEEQIAYGQSVGYLRQKGHTDKDIINNNMMPYLVTLVDVEAVVTEVLSKSYPIAALTRGTIDKLAEQNIQKINKQIRSVAYRMGEQIIKQYGGDQIAVKKEKASKRIELDSEF